MPDKSSQHDHVSSFQLSDQDIIYEACVMKLPLTYFALLGAFKKLRNANISYVTCLSICLSVRPSAWNNSAPNGRILTKFDI